MRDMLLVTLVCFQFSLHIAFTLKFWHCGIYILLFSDGWGRVSLVRFHIIKNICTLLLWAFDVVN